MSDSRYRPFGTYSAAWPKRVRRKALRRREKVALVTGRIIPIRHEVVPNAPLRKEYWYWD